MFWPPIKSSTSRGLVLFRALPCRETWARTSRHIASSLRCSRNRYEPIALWRGEVRSFGACFGFGYGVTCLHPYPGIPQRPRCCSLLAAVDGPCKFRPPYTVRAPLSSHGTALGSGYASVLSRKWKGCAPRVTALIICPLS